MVAVVYVAPGGTHRFLSLLRERGVVKYIFRRHGHHGHHSRKVPKNQIVERHDSPLIWARQHCLSIRLEDSHLDTNDFPLHGLRATASD